MRVNLGGSVTNARIALTRAEPGIPELRTLSSIGSATDSEMTTSTDSQNTKPEAVLPLLERALKFRYALLLVSLIEAIEVARGPLKALGFPEFNWHAQHSSVPLGTLLVFTAAYLFFMTAVSPAIQRIVENVLSYVRWLPPVSRLLDTDETMKQESFDKKQRYELNYHYGLARLDDAKYAALMTKDDFWIKRIDEHRARIKASEEKEHSLASVSFSCTLLLLAIWWTQDGISWVHIAISSLFENPFTWAKALARLLALGTCVLIVSPWILSLSSRAKRCEAGRWIEHPQLAAQRSKKPRAMAG